MNMYGAGDNIQNLIIVLLMLLMSTPVQQSLVRIIRIRVQQPWQMTAKWFYPALAARVRPETNEAQVAFVEHLDSPGRVVIEIVPDQRIGFDAEEMVRDSPAGPSRSSV